MPESPEEQKKAAKRAADTFSEYERMMEESERAAKQAADMIAEYWGSVGKLISGQEPRESKIRSTERVVQQVKEIGDTIAAVTAALERLELLLSKLDNPTVLRMFKSNLDEVHTKVKEVLKHMTGVTDEAAAPVGVFQKIWNTFIAHMTKAWEELLRVLGPFGEMVHMIKGLIGGTAFSILALVAASRVLQSQIEVLGARVLMVFESVTTGATKLSMTLGDRLYQITTTWYLSTSEVMRLATGWILVFGKAILESSQSIDQFLSDWVKKAKYWSQVTGLTPEVVQSFFQSIVMGLGRTAGSIYQAEGAFAVLAATAKGTRFTVQEFIDIVKGAQSDLGLFGTTADNVNAIVMRLSEAFRGIGYTVPGGLQALRGFAQSWMRLEAQLAQQPGWLLFLTGRLAQPVAGIGELWRSLVQSSEQYFRGGAGGLVLEYIHRLSQMVTGRTEEERRGAMGFALMQQMGLPASMASVLDRFIQIVGSLSRRGIPLDRDVLEYLRTGDEKLLQRISHGNREVMQTFKELRDVSSKFSQDTTDLLTKVATLLDIFVKRIFTSFMNVLVDILLMIAGAAFKVASFQFVDAGRLVRAGWSLLKEDVEILKSSVQDFTKQGKDVLPQLFMHQRLLEVMQVAFSQEESKRDSKGLERVFLTMFKWPGLNLLVDLRPDFPESEKKRPDVKPQRLQEETVTIQPDFSMVGPNINFSIPARLLWRMIFESGQGGYAR